MPAVRRTGQREEEMHLNVTEMSCILRKKALLYIKYLKSQMKVYANYKKIIWFKRCFLLNHITSKLKRCRGCKLF